jgi:hypothetical protein
MSEENNIKLVEKFVDSQNGISPYPERDTQRTLK